MYTELKISVLTILVALASNASYKVKETCTSIGIVWFKYNDINNIYWCMNKLLRFCINRFYDMKYEQNFKNIINRCNNEFTRTFTHNKILETLCFFFVSCFNIYKCDACGSSASSICWRLTIVVRKFYVYVFIWNL